MHRILDLEKLNFEGRKINLFSIFENKLNLIFTTLNLYYSI